jgi:hypothetical protein
MAEQSAVSGADLEEALKQGSLQSRHGSLVGMVDNSDKKNYIRFTATDCNEWLDMPVDMIETWVVEGHERCDDHSHPRVRLTLKEPEDAGQRPYFALLSQLLAAAPRIKSPPITDEIAFEPALARERLGRLGGRGGGGYSPCLYYSCGTCSDGTVMLCSDMPGCPPDLCTDIVLPVSTRRLSRF